MIATTLRAWLTSLVILLVAAAGLFAVSATSRTTSLTQMAVAAAVLSALAAVAGLVVTPPEQRLARRRVLWGGAVPLGCGLGTAVVVGLDAGVWPGIVAGLPWLLGTALAGVIGGRLPDLRVLRLGAVMRQLRDRNRGVPDLDRR